VSEQIPEECELRDVISTLVLTEVSLSFSSLFTLSLDAMTCIKPVIVP